MIVVFVLIGLALAAFVVFVVANLVAPPRLRACHSTPLWSSAPEEATVETSAGPMIPAKPVYVVTTLEPAREAA